MTSVLKASMSNAGHSFNSSSDHDVLGFDAFLNTFMTWPLHWTFLLTFYYCECNFSIFAFAMQCPWVIWNSNLTIDLLLLDSFVYFLSIVWSLRTRFTAWCCGSHHTLLRTPKWQCILIANLCWVIHFVPLHSWAWESGIYISKKNFPQRASKTHP